MTGVAAIVATAAALALDPRVSLAGTGPASVFGWAGDPYRFGAVVASALIPGLFGHTLANYAMGTVSPLVMSSMNLTGPFIGTCLSWGVGVQGAPSATTWTAGTIVILGAGIVTFGGRDKADVRMTIWMWAQSILQRRSTTAASIAVQNQEAAVQPDAIISESETLAPRTSI